MSDNENIKNDEEFKYSTEYFNYHRNGILFLSLCSMITILGIIPSYSEFLSRESVQTGMKYLPLLLWFSGAYSLFMFIPEWIACAKPHRTNLKKFVEKVDRSVEQSAATIEMSRSEIGLFKSCLDEEVARIVKLKNHSEMNLYFSIIEKIKNQALVIKGDESWNEFEMGLEDLRVILDESDFNIASIFMQFGVNESEAELLAANIKSLFRPGYTRIEKAWAGLMGEMVDLESGGEKSLEMVQAEVQASDERIDSALDRIERYKASVKDMEDNLGNVLSTFKSIRKFPRKDKWPIFIKTDFGGMFVPAILFVVSTVGSLNFYTKYYFGLCLIDSLCNVERSILK
jgi:hypothetical protein